MSKIRKLIQYDQCLLLYVDIIALSKQIYPLYKCTMILVTMVICVYRDTRALNAQCMPGQYLTVS